MPWQFNAASINNRSDERFQWPVTQPRPSSGGIRWSYTPRSYMWPLGMADLQTAMIMYWPVPCAVKRVITCFYFVLLSRNSIDSHAWCVAIVRPFLVSEARLKLSCDELLDPGVHVYLYEPTKRIKIEALSEKQLAYQYGLERSRSREGRSLLTATYCQLWTAWANELKMNRIKSTPRRGCHQKMTVCLITC